MTGRSDIQEIIQLCKNILTDREIEPDNWRTLTIHAGKMKAEHYAANAILHAELALSAYEEGQTDIVIDEVLRSEDFSTTAWALHEEIEKKAASAAAASYGRQSSKELASDKDREAQRRLALHKEKRNIRKLAAAELGKTPASVTRTEYERFKKQLQRDRKRLTKRGTGTATGPR